MYINTKWLNYFEHSMMLLAKCLPVLLYTIW